MASTTGNGGPGNLNPEGLSLFSFGGGGEYRGQQQDNFASATPGDGAQLTQSIYAAFGDYEKKARERKYMIAECEDMIEGLQKGLAERKQTNQTRKAELETLQMKAEATKASFQRSEKEKSLIQRDYQNLRDQMDELSEKKAKKIAFMNAVRDRRKQNAERCKKLEDQHLAAYLKNRKVADVMKQKKEVELLKGKIRELTLLENNLVKDKEVVGSEHKLGFEIFVKQCVEAADGRREALQKMELNKKLEAQTKNIFKRPPAVAYPLRSSSNTSSSHIISSESHQSPLPKLQMLKKTSSGSLSSPSQALGRMMTTNPTIKRPAAFEEMDRLLNQSDSLARFTKRASKIVNQLPHPPIQSDSAQPAGGNMESRVAQLKARLLHHRPPPIMIRPIPRTVPSADMQNEGPAEKEMGNILTEKPPQLGIPIHDDAPPLPVNSNPAVEVLIASQSNDNPASYLSQPGQACTPKDTTVQLVMEESFDERADDVPVASQEGQADTNAAGALLVGGDVGPSIENQDQGFLPFGVSPSASTGQQDQFQFGFDFFATAAGNSGSGNNDNGGGGISGDSFFNFFN